MEIYHMTTDLQSSPKEMQLLESCVSFEEACICKIIAKSLGVRSKIMRQLKNIACREFMLL